MPDVFTHGMVHAAAGLMCGVLPDDALPDDDGDQPGDQGLAEIRSLAPATAALAAPASVVGLGSTASGNEWAFAPDPARPEGF